MVGSKNMKKFVEKKLPDQDRFAAVNWRFHFLRQNGLAMASIASFVWMHYGDDVELGENQIFYFR